MSRLRGVFQAKIESLNKKLQLSREQNHSVQTKLAKLKKKSTEDMQMNSRQRGIDEQRMEIGKTKTAVGRKELLHLCHQLHLLMIRHKDNLIRLV